MDVAAAKQFIESIDVSHSPRHFASRAARAADAATSSRRLAVLPFLSSTVVTGGRAIQEVQEALPRLLSLHEASVSRPLLERMSHLAVPNDLATGIVVGGGTVRALWSISQVSIEPRPEPGVWSATLPRHGTIPAPLLIEFHDGLMAATALLPSFAGAVLRDVGGVAALTYRSIYDPDKTYGAAERAIALMDRGALRATAAINLAVQLRGMKHYDPVLGVISAYLYDAIGDLDSIRRIAGYYVQYGQPIPYDIALLAMLRGEWRANGEQLWAVIPPVAAREPRTKAEQDHSWTTSGMHEAEGVVGGFWPWMRQGWAFLEDPAERGSQLIRRGLPALTNRLARGRFATFDTDGGRMLAKLFAMEPVWTAA